MLAARRALSHRGGRVLALGRFLRRKRSKVSGQPFKDSARGSCMLMACGAARPLRTPNSCGEKIRRLYTPTTGLLPLPSCSPRLFVKDLVVTETLGLCLILGAAHKSQVRQPAALGFHGPQKL